MDHVMLLLVCVSPVALCYSSGQVKDSCEDMRPHHSGLSPQTEPAPFTVITDHSSYRLGEEVKVQLQAPASTPFIGFLLQAREVGKQSPVGSFSVIVGTTQHLSCNQRPNSAVSHRSESLKTSIEVMWRPEASEYTKAIQFHASFVQNYKTFWVDVRSPALTITNDSSGGSTPTTPTMTTAITIHQLPPPVHISSADCSITKVCFSQPSNCDPAVSADCYFMSAMMSPNDAAVHYEMTGPSDGYISFGFSEDQLMGNDDIYICGIGSNSLVQLQYAFSTGRTAPHALPLGNVSDVRASVQDRVISCSFTSMNPISTHRRTTGFNKTYHLMFAHGSSNNGQIQFHTATFISTDKVDISRPQLVRKAGRPHVIKAHGALMLIAWMTMGSLGMMVARYLKRLVKGQSLWGKDVWFLVHVAAMSVTIATTIIAVILSFSYIKVWSGGAHPVLGCLVMILSVFQPIMALLRCGPQHPLRFVFNWSHALSGVTIKALSVAAILTGLKLIDSTLNKWLMKVIGGFVAWEVLFYILLEVCFKRKVDSTDTLEPKMKTVGISLMAVFFLGNITFLMALLVGIGREDLL